MEQLQSQLERLVKSKALNFETKAKKQLQYQGKKWSVHSDILLEAGDICRGIVIEKDEKRKQLIMHLTYLAEKGKKTLINHLGFRGIIRDYDLKQEFSIFTYLQNFGQVKVGTEIISEVRRKIERDEKTFYEMTIKQSKHHELGISQEDVEIFEKEMKSYEKYGRFPITFLTQYQEQFSNPGLFHNLSKDLKIAENRTIDPQSNIQALNSLNLEYQRVRQKQEKQWAEQHFTEGVICLKNGQTEQALAHLDCAKNFDRKNTNILIARGCALCNVNNLIDGLKEMKEALYISPSNVEAQKYYAQIREEIKNKDKSFSDNKKNSYGKQLDFNK